MSNPKQKLLQLFEGNKDSGNNDYVNLLACPISLKPLQIIKRSYGPYATETFLVNNDYGTKYKVNSNYFDMTIPSDSQFVWDMTQRELIGQKFFQNPFISSIYERGYRQNFEIAGFPGIEKEFIEARDFFLTSNASTILDLSCGSGFMTRKFINSNNFGRVIGADLSPNMLLESRSRCIAEKLPLPLYVRCDSAKLPFKSNSLDAVHAGAAMHCWPNINESIAEIYRVLKPGGVFYASTFFTMNLPGDGNSNRGIQSQGFYFFKSEKEIADILTLAGFGNDTGLNLVRREGARCAIVKGAKGPVADVIKDILLEI
eukprot:gene6291-8663_t